MRLEATISDVRAAQLDDVVEELKTTRSQIVEEALALFLKAYMEAKSGRRVAIIEAESRRAVAEVVSPSLTQLEWAARKEKIVLSAKGMKRVAPTPALPPGRKRVVGKKKR